MVFMHAIAVGFDMLSLFHLWKKKLRCNLRQKYFLRNGFYISSRNPGGNSSEILLWFFKTLPRIGNWLLIFSSRWFLYLLQKLCWKFHKEISFPKVKFAYDFTDSESPTRFILFPQRNIPDASKEAFWMAWEWNLCNTVLIYCYPTMTKKKTTMCQPSEAP